MHEDISFANKSYCISRNSLGGGLVAVDLNNGEKCVVLFNHPDFDASSPTIMHSNKGTFAFVTHYGCRIRFFKVNVPG